MNFFIARAWDEPFFFFSWVGVIIFSICVHEYAHARVALWCGDDTAAAAGHLSLNPLRQMGPTSLVALLVVGIAWGAVPINPRQLRSRGAAAAVAVAGPAANLLLAVLSALLLAVVIRGDLFEGEAGLPAKFLTLACRANGVLFLFNLMPVPMFDGWSVGALFFPGLRTISPAAAQNISWIFLLAVFVTPVGGAVWRGGIGLADLIFHGWALLFGLLGRGAG